MNQDKENAATQKKGLAVDLEITTDLRMTLRGTLKLCTQEDMEIARLKRQRMIRRQAAENVKDCLNITTKIQMPFVERYIVLDTVASTRNHSNHDASINNQTDDDLISEAVIIAEPNNEIVSCQKATIHSYNSLLDYQRFCNSARKKQRLRVDRVIDTQIDSYNCSDFEVLDKETDFIVQSVDGSRVLASWFLRASSRDLKLKWMKRLSLDGTTDLYET